MIQTDLMTLMSSYVDVKLNEIKREIEGLKNIFLQPQSNDELLTRKEAAQFFKVSISTIDNWRREGKIISSGIGSKVRFRRSELEQAMVKLKNDSHVKY